MAITTNERRIFTTEVPSLRSPTVPSPNSPTQRKRARSVQHLSDQASIEKTGTIIASDNAFVDIALENRDVSSPSLAHLFEIKSIRRSNHVDGRLRITYNHQITYRGEPIYVLETKTECDGTEIWGQSSSCVLSNGQLKIKITNKAKNARHTSVGPNSRENMAYQLAELAELASKARESAIMGDSSL